jgi:uncharacterized lipoprotein
MKSMIKVFSGITVVLLLSACDSDNDTSISAPQQTQAPTAQLQVMHAVADAPTVSVSPRAH